MKSLHICISIWFFFATFPLQAAEKLSGVEELSDIEVTEDFDDSERVYNQKNGKRFFTKIYGNAQSILKIAKQTKINGHIKK